MNAKALLAAGLVMAAGAVTSVAQTVYSVNVVGFVNLTVPPGFSMIAAQLNAGSSNSIASLFPTVPNNTKIFKFNGTSFDSFEFFTGLGWFPNGTATLLPGEGAFIRNPTVTNMTLTVVGEVSVGTNSVVLPAGFSIRSSIIPQAGLLNPDLEFVPASGDKIFRFSNVANAYNSFEYFTSPVVGWFPSDPSVSVGESVFVRKVSAGTWTRRFNVN